MPGGGHAIESASVVIKSNYRLTTIPDGAVETEGIALGKASYDRVAIVRAAGDGEIRDVKVIADNIRLRLVVARCDQ